jgi:hypothetical protein
MKKSAAFYEGQKFVALCTITRHVSLILAENYSQNSQPYICICWKHNQQSRTSVINFPFKVYMFRQQTMF